MRLRLQVGDLVHVYEFPDAEAVGVGELEEAYGSGMEVFVDVEDGRKGCWLVVCDSSCIIAFGLLV